MPKHYKLKEDIVEAVQLTAENVKAASFWSGGTEVVEIDPFDDSIRFAALNVETPDGVKRASEGDWIVRRGPEFTVVGPFDFSFRFVEVE